jgi:ABC-2 type transport system permease protein
MKGHVMAAMARHLWRQHHRPMLIMAGGVMLFQFLITRMAPAPEDVSWLSTMLAAVPSQLLALAGGQAAFGSASGVIAIGYGHPFVLLLLSVWAIRLPSGALAGEIGRGTMDLLAARPMGRWQLVAAVYAAIAAGLALLTAAAWAGTAIGLSLRPLGVTGRPFAGVAAMAWLLFMTWGAIGLLVSATRRDAGAAIAWASGVMATSFVVDYLARVWKPMARLSPFSLFAYYRPQDIVSAGVHLADIVRLAAVAVVAIAIAVVVFNRRDL